MQPRQGCSIIVRSIKFIDAQHARRRRPPDPRGAVVCKFDAGLFQRALHLLEGNFAHREFAFEFGHGADLDPRDRREPWRGPIEKATCGPTLSRTHGRYYSDAWAIG